MSGYYVTKALVKRVLESWQGQIWEVQGLGMLRTRISDSVRLHVWHEGLIYANKPSEIHNHPWDFESHIVVGMLRNMVYCQASFGEPTVNVGTIVCGVGGSSEPADVTPKSLILHTERVYMAGESYTQAAEDFHQTVFQNGTVTLVRRKFKDDTEHAQVAFPLDGKWQSAEPRRPKLGEVSLAVGAALELF